jgi:hypothetical protein
MLPRWTIVVLVTAGLDFGNVIADTLRVPSDYPTIQTAVDAATSGDEVLVAPGVYEEAISITTANIALVSELEGAVTVRHAAFEPVITAEADSFRMSGFHIDKLMPSGGSRAIDLLGTEFNVDGCIVSHGSPGFAINGAHGRIQRSVISDCDRGIGMLSSQLTIDRCRVINNFVLFGGIGAGILIDDSELTVTECHFIRNEVENVGAAIFIVAPSPEFPSPSRAVVERCTFVDNKSRGGPAIAAGNCDLSIVSCTMIRNKVLPSSLDLGVVDLAASIGSVKMVVERCILAFNDGRAIACHNQAMPTIACCDLFDNESSELCGIDAGDNLYQDPLFCDVTNEAPYLSSNSPCAAGNAPGACGLIGALPVGCVDAVMDQTWGAIKWRFKARR